MDCVFKLRSYCRRRWTPGCVTSIAIFKPLRPRNPEKGNAIIALLRRVHTLLRDGSCTPAPTVFDNYCHIVIRQTFRTGLQTPSGPKRAAPATFGQQNRVAAPSSRAWPAPTTIYIVPTHRVSTRQALHSSRWKYAAITERDGVCNPVPNVFAAPRYLTVLKRFGRGNMPRPACRIQHRKSQTF